MDKINPERVQNRENAKYAKSMLPGLRAELFNVSTTPDRKIELRQQINDCKDALALWEDNWDAIKGVAGIGGVITTAKFAVDLIDKVEDIAKKVLNISYLRIASEQFKKSAESIQLV